MKLKILTLILIFVTCLESNLWLPCPKPLSGHLESSVGFHFRDDHLFIRNWQIRSLLYLYPGVRLNGVFRTNRELNLIEFSKGSNPAYYKLNPIIDEGYLELFGHYNYKCLKFSNSIRTGRIRYYTFPEYKFSGRFEQVAGLSDIRNRYQASGYNGIILSSDLGIFDNFGLHTDCYVKEYNYNNIMVLSTLIYFRYANNWLNAEARTGKLIVRNHSSDKVLENTDWGWAMMLGTKWKGYDLNLYFEKVKNIIYTGLSVRFASSLFSRIAGKLRFDYNRACKGFVIQYPFFYRNVNISGNIHTKIKKVGEIKAERIISFWRVGMQRNFYEHILSRNGITDFATCEVIIKSEPM